LRESPQPKFDELHEIIDEAAIRGNFWSDSGHSAGGADSLEAPGMIGFKEFRNKDIPKRRGSRPHLGMGHL
jgi:hypothetical protein